MSEQLRRLRVLARVVQAFSALVALAAAAGGIVYLTVTASDLPSWWPGNIAHSTNAHHVARGWVLLILAVVAIAVVAVATWAMAGTASSPEQSAGTASSPEQ